MMMMGQQEGVNDINVTLMAPKSHNDWLQFWVAETTTRSHDIIAEFVDIFRYSVKAKAKAMNVTLMEFIINQSRHLDN